jgi:hypothetical protein
MTTHLVTRKARGVFLAALALAALCAGACSTGGRRCPGDGSVRPVGRPLKKMLEPYLER